jgi:hypothetical protein
MCLVRIINELRGKSMVKTPNYDTVEENKMSKMNIVTTSS